MFFLTYLGRELRRRMKQAVVIAVGLALGVGLVITVAAASSGVKKAQDQVLRSLYGVGTDVTVTKTPSAASPGSERISLGGPAGGNKSSGPGGPGGGVEQCINGKCRTLTGGKIENLTSVSYAPLTESSVAKVAKLHDVADAAGGLALNATDITIPTQSDPNAPAPNTFTVDGVDLGHRSLGPLGSGTLHSGRAFTSADANSDVAMVDSYYATQNKLKAGSTISIAKKSFKVIGVVDQSQGSGAPDVYIPLARAQALATKGPGSTGSLKNDVNTIYVTAANSADIGTVQNEISKAMPHTTVTTAASLANEITGSVSSTAKLANDLGRWLSILVLIAAFAVASLLTMAAVTRRVREFGTLKALGWRGRRLIAQVLGESVTTGIIGGALGVGLGFLGAEVITKVAPKLTASYTQASGQHFFGGQTTGGGPVSGGPGTSTLGGSLTHTVSVPWVASVGGGTILIAVLLALLGGLLAGTIGSWRIGRLRPAVALATVE
jgi:putative ABC transport system permease protein